MIHEDRPEPIPLHAEDDGLESPEALSILAPMRSLRPMICDADEFQDRRNRLLPSLRAHVTDMAAKRRTAQVWRYSGLAGAGAVAAGMLVWFAAFQPDSSPSAARSKVDTSGAVCQVSKVQGDVHRTLQGETRRVSVGASLSPTEAIHTAADASASVSTPRGVGLDVGGSSDLEFLGHTLQGEQVRLFRGTVRAQVPKLGSDASFSVVTPDARVTVHGTAFTVTVDNGESCVRVSEGAVAVHPAGSGKTMLGPGDQWGCERDSTERNAFIEYAQAVETTTAVKRRPKPTTPRSTLGAENKLFQEALLAQKRGDTGAARRLFEQFVDSYPKAALAGRARLQLRQLRAAE